MVVGGYPPSALVELYHAQGKTELARQWLAARKQEWITPSRNLRDKINN